MWELGLHPCVIVGVSRSRRTAGLQSAGLRVEEVGCAESRATVRRYIDYASIRHGASSSTAVLQILQDRGFRFDYPWCGVGGSAQTHVRHGRSRRTAGLHAGLSRTFQFLCASQPEGEERGIGGGSGAGGGRVRARGALGGVW